VKKILGLLLVTHLFNNSLIAQSDKHKSYWEDPAVFEENQTLPHAFKLSYNSIDEAIENDKSTCPNFQSLNGQWRFKWLENPQLVPEDFYSTRFNMEDWDTISVPSCWQMAGYGHPKFRNVHLTYTCKPPKVPADYNPTGLYKKKFTIPAEWIGKEIMLRFEGVKAASSYWINGIYLGYNEGSFEPAEFNITTYVSEGENELSVSVLRFCDGTYLENQDMWKLSGIFRDVELYAVPKVTIRDYYVSTDFDENYQDAELDIELILDNYQEKKVSGCRISIDVLDLQNNSILREPLQKAQLKIKGQGNLIVQLNTLVINPKQWSAEKPNLYMMLVALYDGSGQLLEAFSQKIGFIEVENDGEKILVNGEAVKLNGVNSHMHHPEFGNTVPLETLKKDLLIMKQHNINCVRTSHYPPEPAYLDLANEIGMYIVDEVNDEAHYYTYLSGDTAWREAYKDRSRKLVYRDRNHPCIILWSAGNESGSGENIKAVIETGKAIDPNRPAWMYGGNAFVLPCEDVIGPRYWIPERLRAIAEGKVLNEEDTRPSFMDEYLAATGNALGGLDEYWDCFYNYPRLIGGAIWDWVSPGITTPLRLLPDASNSGNDGAIMGRPDYIEGREGNAIMFSGHDDWVEFYRSHSLNITGNEITIEFLVKPYKIEQTNTFLAKGSWQYGIVENTKDSLEFYLYSGSHKSVKSALPEDWYGSWHHIAGIYNGKNISLYIDYKPVASVDHTGNIDHSPFPVCIGRNTDIHDQGDFSGRLSHMAIDDVRIYNRAIAINELKTSSRQSLDEKSVLALNFEKELKGDDFYSTGLGGRTYGIIWPDREIQPEIYQIKKSAQPVRVSAVDREAGVFEVSNRHSFTNLDEYDVRWEITSDGVLSDEGSLELNLPPGEMNQIQIPYRLSDLKAENECLVLIQFLLKNDTKWARSGYEVAWEQFSLPVETLKSQASHNESLQTLDVKNLSSKIIITGNNFNYIIDKATGLFSRLEYNGMDYLEYGPVFSIWRAPLAIDVDPWGSHIFQKDHYQAHLGRSIDAQCRTLGIDTLEIQVDKINVKQVNPSLVEININVRSSSYKGMSSFDREETYKISGDGSIQIKQTVSPNGYFPEYLPKTGLRFHIPKSFTTMEWFGRGPFETYPDRKTGAKIGQYIRTVKEDYVPYIMPQDYGNHSDVYWLKVMDNDKRGFYFTSGNLFNFSVHPYSTDNLSRAIHSYQLKEADYNTINIDFEVSGVGGGAIRTLQQYRVLPAMKKYDLTIKPF